ncbi:hypothetical protein C1I63_11900 [Rathayibacter caricis DSM 15933]|uniref:Glycosyltransferase n=1 Tax=Rathayibacter caricis DSM 15933 TaxID=1328867 RepID=A0A2T4UVB8_9MICO|nr:hypothetical protein [Rathayibacter caricis]PTL73478.1 hypothetical protein C1I63_11900 [Rathayibacter caricis DSM 15933]
MLSALRLARVPLISTLLSNARIAASMIVLSIVNLTSRAPVTAPDGPVVSLTSYSKRVDQVHLTIESIARGSQKPSRLILWLDEQERLANPPRALRRLVARGLEIRETPNYGPHKKYYPYAAGTAHHSVPLVTSDDDTMYPEEWLASLVRAHRVDPEMVVAHRVNLIEIRDGAIAPYSSWRRATSTSLSPRNFAVGVRGILYPPAFLDVLREQGTGFEDVAPRADDVWLHWNLIRSGRRVRPILELPAEDFLPVRGGGRVAGLWASNIDSGGNDEQIRRTYAPEEVAVIVGG